MTDQLDPVFRRTPAGQRQALLDHLTLSPQARLLLLLVNGYSPISSLWPRIGEGAREAVRELEGLGLIELRLPEADMRGRSRKSRHRVISELSGAAPVLDVTDETVQAAGHTI